MNDVMHELFRDLEEKDIRYLHFKSNTELAKSFDGRGDFDVLIDPGRIADAEAVIAAHSGKRLNPPRLGRYPGVDNWLILDRTSGILYHLHLHYQLATGKALVKDYIIPWRDLLFETRIKDPEYDIYITDPCLELLLLLVRTVVKSTPGQRFKTLFGNYNMYPSMQAEFRDLKEKSYAEAFMGFVRRCGFPEEDTGIFRDLLKSDTIDGHTFRRLQGAVRANMRLDRRMSGPAASVLSAYYMVRRKLEAVVKSHSDNTAMIKKVHDTRGLIVAFVGVDGSGKSTLTKEIYSWLNKKTECKRFYMGSGDGRVPLSMRLLNLFKQKKRDKRIAEGRTGGGRDIQTVSMYKNPVKFARRMLRMRALYDVQKANNRKIRIMQRYRLNGGIALLDRYPQTELTGMNDGPKIVELRETFAEKGPIDRLIKKEQKMLDIVKEVKPDIIFRLNISAETSMARKPEQTEIELFRKKIEDLNRITFSGADIVDIDAEQPYEQELIQIKGILWDLI